MNDQVLRFVLITASLTVLVLLYENLPAMRGILIFGTIFAVVNTRKR
jgi:hypothetical protein